MKKLQKNTTQQDRKMKIRREWLKDVGNRVRNYDANLIVVKEKIQKR
jgi:hypothetical protein